MVPERALRHEVVSLTIDPPFELNMRSLSNILLITTVVVSIRPVLKHGPRSLVNARVAQS